MRKKVTDLNSLKMAKLELRNDLELRRAIIELEYSKLKDHYVGPFKSNSENSLLSLIPSLIKPFFSQFIARQLSGSKGKLGSAFWSLLLAFFNKKKKPNEK